MEEKVGNLKHKVKSYTDLNKAHQKELGTAQADVEVAKRELQKEMDAAAEMGFDEVEPSATKAKLTKKIEAIEAKLSKERSTPAQLEAVAKAWKEKNTAMKAAMYDVDAMEKLTEELKKDLADRVIAAGDMRQSVGWRTKMNFTALLSQRGYEGKMRIKHDKEEVDMEVHPRGDAGKEKKVGAGNTSSLSGGERSFTTASFILALWDSMDVPFRCLDEFDVFMDTYNRKIAIRMLVEVARRNQHRQFILLSPLNLKLIDELRGPDINIKRLYPPIRGQTTLVDGRGCIGNAEDGTE